MVQSNILVDNLETAKLSDFGISLRIDYPNLQFENDVCTYRYSAVESMNPYGDRPITTAMDVWAYAMTALEVRHEYNLSSFHKLIIVLGSDRKKTLR